MIIAAKKKQENIIEYLLYMWQVESIIRSKGLDPDRIRLEVVNSYAVDDETKAEIAAWYDNLIEMMRTENIVQTGHLQINRNVIIDLTDLHLQLLRSTRQPFYTAAFYKTLPFIVELRAKAGEHAVGEIETCFTALYGILLLRMQGKEISTETLQATAQISNLLNQLNQLYLKERNGDLEL